MALSLCAGIAANTGGIDCDVAPGVPAQFAVWSGKILPSTYNSADAIQVAFEQAALLPNSDANKLFMFPIIQEVADNTEANTEGTLGLGFKTIIREGRQAYTFKAFAGIAQVKNLRKFNNTTIPIIVFDSNNRIWGASVANNFVGAKARVFVSGLKFANGQAIEEGVVSITISFLDPKVSTDNAAFLEISNTSSMQGMNDVKLIEFAAHASNVYKIQAYVPTGEMGVGINLADTYAAALTVGAWYAKTGVGYGTPLTITSVVASAPGWNVTLDSTAYTALAAGATIKIGLVDPSVLNTTYSVTGLEAIPIIVTK